VSSAIRQTTSRRIPYCGLTNLAQFVKRQTPLQQFLLLLVDKKEKKNEPNQIKLLTDRLTNAIRNCPPH